jgi:hypothetical protein
VDYNVAILGALSAGTASRFVVGYPLYGTWVRPVLRYADVDGNAIISANEMSFGDSSVFAGAPYPNYTASLSNNFSVFNRVTIGITMQYQNGMTQEYLPSSLSNLRSWNDPSTPLPIQAYQAAALQTGGNGSLFNGPGSAVGFVQTVSTLRLNALSIGYAVPARLSRYVIRAHQMRISLQGTNLRLWSNYRGKDPNVNSDLRDFSTDTGVLPAPRTWMLTVGIN